MSILKKLKTPVFYAEGMPKGVTRENYRLQAGGFLEKGLVKFTFEDIENMPFTETDSRLTSVSQWSVRAIWQGVKFSDFMKLVKPTPKASHVNFESYNNYTTCLPINQLIHENVLICYKVSGEYLEPEYGGPVRMIVPHLWGYKSIKGLEKISFIDTRIPGYWETRGYSDSAEIEACRVLDVNSGQMRYIMGGEVKEF